MPSVTKSAINSESTFGALFVCVFGCGCVRKKRLDREGGNWVVFWDMHIGRRTKCNFKLSIVIDQKDQYTKLNDNFRQPKRSKKSGILVLRSLKFYTCWITLEFTMMGILTAAFRNRQKNYVKFIEHRTTFSKLQRKSPRHTRMIYLITNHISFT